MWSASWVVIFGMRHLLYQESSAALRLGLGRKGAPAVADVTRLTRRQLLGSVRSMMMQPQVLCGTWHAVVACSFINFVLYATSTVIAFLEWRAGKKAAPATQQVQVAKPAAAVQPAAEPVAQAAA